MYKPKREYWKMTGQVVYRPKQVHGGEVWVSETDTGKLHAVAFSGRRQKPDWHHLFNNRGHLERHVRDWIQGCTLRAAYRKEWAEARKGGRHPFKPGDILEGSWGYEQTNIEFYEVTRAKGATVWIRELVARNEGSQGLQDCLVPCKGAYRENSTEEQRRPQTHDGGKTWYVKLHESCNLRPWTGSAHYQTAFGFGH